MVAISWKECWVRAIPGAFGTTRSGVTGVQALGTGHVDSDLLNVDKTRVSVM